MSGSDATGAPAYWSTAVSRVDDAHVVIRGYQLTDLIGRLPYAASCYLLIRGQIPTPAQARVLDGILNAVLDFGLYKPGTVAARYTVSANPSMVAGLAASVLAVGEHTLAPEAAGRFILAAYQRLQESEVGPAALAEQLVVEARERKQRIPGFGHPVFTYLDPRAQRLKELAMEAGLWNGKARLYEEVHAAFTRLPGRATIPINDVGVIAAILAEMGFTPAEMTGLAIVSVLPGVIAHISEELHGGVPIRIVPDSIAEYTDRTSRSLVHDAKEAGWEVA